VREIMAVEIRDTLQRDFGIPLPATTIFDHPTLDAIASHVAQTLFPEATMAIAPPRAARASHDEPIAIVGIGCRFPGGADSPSKLWPLLRDGFDAITEVPGSSAYYLGGFVTYADASKEDLDTLLREASPAAGDHKFRALFLRTEWDQVVDAWQLGTWEAYRDVKPRNGPRRAPADRSGDRHDPRGGRQRELAGDDDRLVDHANDPGNEC
jgi:hypothetical protein